MRITKVTSGISFAGDVGKRQAYIIHTKRQEKHGMRHTKKKVRIRNDNSNMDYSGM